MLASLIAENLSANTLFACLPSFVAGIFLAYLFWGVRGGRLAHAETRTAELRSEAERLRQQQARLKSQLDN